MSQNNVRHVPVLVIHGGAGSRIPEPDHATRLEYSLRNILDAVYPLLIGGADAVEAAVQAVRLLESDPLYNAGRGSKIQEDGVIRMSASVMSGWEQRFGGVASVRGIKHPVSIAQQLLTERDRVLIGKHAAHFAKARNLDRANPYTTKARELHRARVAGKMGTVGAVALDTHGRLAAATSTGGRGGETPGRMSDSVTVAANYASLSAAVSATGVGEHIVEHAVAPSIVIRVDDGMSVSEAMRRTLKTDVACTNGDFGCIALDCHGNFVGGTRTDFLIWGAAKGNGRQTNP